MSDIKILNPDALGKPLGQYSHLTRVKASEFVFIAGQVGVLKDGKLAFEFDEKDAEGAAAIEDADAAGGEADAAVGEAGAEEPVLV